MGEGLAAQESPRSGAEWLALGLTLALAVLAPLVRADWLVAGYKIGDAVTVGVPLLLVGSVPYLRVLGADRMPRFAIEVPALLFLVLALPSVAVAQFPVRAALTWLRYASYIALAWVAAAVFVREANRRLFMWSAAAIAGVTALRAFAQVLWPAAADAEFALTGGVVRAFAWMVNPNFYSEYLVLMIALALALIVSERGGLRAAAGVLLVLFAVALAFTYTRGSWIGLAIGLLVWASFVDWRLLAGLGGAGLLLLLVPGVGDRALSAFTLDASSSDRLNLWRMALDVIRAHPLLGVGVGGYLDAFRAAVEADPSFLVGDLRMTPHNSVLFITAEIGLAGGVAFAWLLARAVRLGSMFARRFGADRRAASVNAALAAGVVAFVCNSMVSNSFQHPQAAVFFWLLIGLMMGNAHAAWTGESAGPAWLSRLPRTRGGWLLSFTPVRALLGPGRPLTQASETPGKDTH
jgi:putative inorganic carbon (HCO3(-)) transporter